MNRFKKWLIPLALVCLLLASLAGCSSAPASLGEIFDPSGNPFANRFSDVKDIRTATFVVAASDSEHKYEADYWCSGVNDHIQVQAALDALPATGGEVTLLDGTYNVEVSLVLDSYQTLSGCGRNTILTTTTPDLDIIMVTGGAGTEKVGILIADLCVDGNAGGAVNDDGIKWDYVDQSKIVDVWVIDNGLHGILINHGDLNEVIGVYASNTAENVYLTNGYNNTVSSSTLQGSNNAGIYLSVEQEASIIGNVCKGNKRGINTSGGYGTIVGNTIMDCTEYGIYIGGTHNNVSGNTIKNTTLHGIYVGSSGNVTISGNLISECKAGINIGLNCNFNTISSNIVCLSREYGIICFGAHCTISGNNVSSSSQDADNTHSNIGIINPDADYNTVVGNTCRRGDEVNKPKYGIEVNAAGCEKNIIIANDLYDSGSTANLIDVGTCTIIEDDNREITPVQVKHMVYAQNTSGGNLTTGNVVSYEATGAAVGFHSPTAIGDPMVWGMLAEDIDDTEYGYIQTLGGTVLLDATNVGGGAIVIGDLLCTEVGSRARKAAAGHIAFAIAMEDCDVADAVINALIISPRMI